MIRYVIATAFMAVPGIVTAGSSAFLGRALPQVLVQAAVAGQGYCGGYVVPGGAKIFLHLQEERGIRERKKERGREKREGEREREGGR